MTPRFFVRDACVVLLVSCALALMWMPLTGAAAEAEPAAKPAPMEKPLTAPAVKPLTAPAVKPVTATAPVEKPVTTAAPVAKPVTTPEPVAKPVPATSPVAKPDTRPSPPALPTTSPATKSVPAARPAAKPAPGAASATKPATPATKPPAKPAAAAAAATKPAAASSPEKKPAAKPVTASSPAAKLAPAAAAAPKMTPAAPAKSPEEAALEARQVAVRKTFKDKVVPFVTTYCAECHGQRKMKGGVTFHPALKNPSDPAFSRRWKLGLATVNAHDMPPEDADKQPTDAEREMFMAWVRDLKVLSAKDPGAFVIRRLTKTEYGNTLHDLLGVDAKVVAELPDEVAGEGYMNTLSSLQMEQYLGIANAALDQALGSKDAPPTAAELQLLGAVPAPAAGGDADAKAVARKLARRAYRRPATEAELDVLMSVHELGLRQKLDARAARRLMLKAVLVSPQFLYITPANEVAAGREIVPLDDFQLASRLSYLLWATMPDEELSALADQGKLHEPAVLRAQAGRMLKDRRARALFDGFGAQWLGLGELADKTFDTTKFPQMTPALRAAMYDEGRLLFESIVRENRSVVSFVSADYTFLNETLAGIYGMEQSVKGAEMRRVKLTDGNRGGILGMPGILATTSFPNRTSPVKRGVWVLEQVLGQHVPPAPPNVPTLEKQDKKKIANLTLRQRTELHRTNVVCANCHKILDPIGFGLENFDAIGRWRDADETGGAVDAAGELPGGKRFTTPRELKAIIAERSQDLARNLTEKLLAYALCRQLEGYDEIVVDGLMKDIAKDGYRMQSVISAVVTSYPFMNRRVVEVVK